MERFKGSRKLKNVITIQHTQSVHHTNGMIGAWTDWELTALGKQQAFNIGEALRKEVTDQHYVMYASDLLRTKQTADIVASSLEIVPIYKKELREINLGSATGKSVEWLHKNQIKQDMHISSLDYKLLPDAESKRELYDRLLPFLHEIHNSQEENIIIVSHGGTLSMLFYMWHNHDINNLENTEFRGLPGGVSVLNENDKGVRIIRKLNDLSYLSNPV
ncbi:phosphoglycerate mutase family protein [Methanosarcina acetivorans C2A]|uniref:Phosphoglycerate mutase family protein n=1 Tax=Methanosarcina acetivorans (strain ATCC 35395 / DSM 2834 / JCM 12185 / C2A) TaxID=188937 RepID=Q8TLM8_METAC|nr:phosphoglycerate mutase family protein [Methanosarcina acetivorans C2A]